MFGSGLSYALHPVTKQLLAMLTSKQRESMCQVCHSKLLMVLQVRKLQEERDWLQEQIEPGSVDKTKVEPEAPMQLPIKPPVRHLSL